MAIVCVVALLFTVGSASAVTTNFTFETSYTASGVDQWGSTSDGYANSMTYQNFLGVQWDESTSFGGFSYGLFGDKYGFEGSAYTTGKVGLDVFFKGTTGSMDVNLVNDVKLAVTNLSAADGTTGSITVTQNRITLGGGNVFSSIFPTMQMSVDASFQIDAGLRGEFAYGVGSTTSSVDLADIKNVIGVTTGNPLLLLSDPFNTKLRVFSYNLNDSHQITVGATTGTLFGDASVSDLLGTDLPVADLDSPAGLNIPLTASGFINPTRIGDYDVSANTETEFGSITVHDSNALDLSSGTGFTATATQNRILSLGVDPIGLASIANGYPVNPLDPKVEIPGIDITVEATLLKAQLNLDLGLKQTISLAPNTYVRLLSNYDVTYLINGQSVTTNDLRYLLPNDGSAANIQITGKPTQEDWTLTPTVYVAPTVQNQIDLNLASSIQVTAGALTLSSGIIPVPIIPPLYNENTSIAGLGTIGLLDRTINLGNLAEFQGVFRSLRPLVGGAVPEDFSVGSGLKYTEDGLSGTYRAQPIAGTLVLTNSVFDNATALDVPGTFYLKGASNIAGSAGLTVSGTLQIDKGSRFIDLAAGFVDDDGLVATGTYTIGGRLSYYGSDIKTIGTAASFDIIGDLGDPTHLRLDNDGHDAFRHLEQINGKLSITDLSITTDKLLVNSGQLSVLGTSTFTSQGYTGMAGSTLAIAGGSSLDASGGTFGNLSGTGVLSNFSAALGDTTGATFIFTNPTGIVSNPGTLILSGTRPTLGYFARKTGSSTYVDGLATLDTNSGTLVLANSATQSLSGNLTNTVGATIGITMPSTPSTPVAPFSTLSVAGAFTNAGSLIIDGGRFSATTINPTSSSLVQLTRGGEVNLSGSLGSGGNAPVGHWLLDGVVRYNGAAFTTIPATTDLRISGAGHGVRLTNGSDALGALATNNGIFALLNGASVSTTSAFTNNGLLTLGGTASSFTSDGLASNIGTINIAIDSFYDTTAGFDRHWNTGNSIPLTTAGLLTGGGTLNIGGVLYFAAPKRSDGGAPLTGVAAGTTLMLTHQAANTLTDFNYAFGNSLKTVIVPVATQGPDDFLGNPTYTYSQPEFYDGFQNFSTVAGTLALSGAAAERTNASFSVLSGGSLSIALQSTLMVTGASFNLAGGSTVDLKGNLVLGGGANVTTFAVPEGFTFGANTQLGRVYLNTFTNPQAPFYVTTGSATLNSSGTWTNPGSIAGAGTIHGQNIINSGAISAVGGTITLDNPGGTITNTGSLVSGGNSMYSSRLTISNTNVVNSGGAQFYIGSNFDLNHSTSTGAVLVNITGTGRLSLLDTTLTGVTLNSDGAIDIANNGTSTIGGTLSLRSSSILTIKGNGAFGATLNLASGTTVANAGKIYVQPGASLTGGMITNHSLVAFSGPRTVGLTNIDNASDGVVTFAHVTNLQLNGTFSNAGRIELSDESASALPNGVTVSQSQITLLGDTTLTGGGTFQFGGHNAIASTTADNGQTTNYLSTQWRNGSLDLGNVSVDGPAGTVLTIANQTISGQGQLGNGNLAIINDVNGTIRVLGNGSTLTINTYSDPNTDPASPVVDGFRNLGTLDIGEGAKMVVTGGAFHSFDNGVLSEGRYRFAGTLQINGLTSFDNASSLVFGGPDGRITNSVGDTLPIRNNLAAGSLEVRDGAISSFATTAAVPFTNSGTLVAGPGGTLGITGGHFANYANHTLTGGSYSVAGVLKFDGADIFTNAGNITMRGGQIQDASGLNALRNFSTNAGQLRVSDKTTFTLSTAVPVFHQQGSIVVDAGSTLDFGNATVNNFQADAISSGKSDYFVAGTIKSASNLIDHGAHVTLYGPAATLQVATTSTAPQSIGSGSKLTMAGGYIAAYGGGTTPGDISGFVDNSGTWEIGSLATPTAAGGTIRSGASVTFGSSSNTAQIDGNGITRFYGGATDDGTATNLTINKLYVFGTLDLNNTVNFGNNAVLTINGVLANTVSGANFNYNYLSPPTITVNGGLDIRHSISGGFIYNHAPWASIRIDGAQVTTAEASTTKIARITDLTLSDGATLTRLVTTGPASWTYVSMFDDLESISGTMSLSNTNFSSQSPDFTNAGTISLTNSSRMAFAGNFMNVGTVTVTGPANILGSISVGGVFDNTTIGSVSGDVSASVFYNEGQFSGSLAAGVASNSSSFLFSPTSFYASTSFTNYAQFSGPVSGGAVINESTGTFAGNGTIASFQNNGGLVTSARFTMKGDGHGGFGVVENNVGGDMTLRLNSFVRDNGVPSPIWNDGTLHAHGAIGNDLSGFGTIHLDDVTVLTGANDLLFGNIYLDHGSLEVADASQLGGAYFGHYGKVFMASGTSLQFGGTNNHDLVLSDDVTIAGYGSNPAVIPAGLSTTGKLTLGGLTVGGINATNLVLAGGVTTSTATLENLSGFGTLTITSGSLQLHNATLTSGNINYGIRMTDPYGSASLVGPTLDASIDNLGTNIYFDAANPLTYHGIISGPTGVTIRGAATTYDHQQFYTGVTTINSGTSLTFADGTGLAYGNGLISVAVGNVAGNILNNGTLVFNSSHDQTIGTASFYDANNDFQTVHYGIAGNGSIIKAGSNTLTATDASFLNNLTIQSGVFQAGDGTTAINGLYGVTNNGTLRLNAVGTSVITLTGTGNFESYGAGGVTLAMVGGGNIDHFGPGTLTLASGNTNTGKVRVGVFASTIGLGNTAGGGTLVISSDSGLGATPAAFTADALTINGGTLATDGFALTLGSNRGVTVGPLGAAINPGAGLTIPTPLTASAGAGTVTVNGSSIFSALNLVLRSDAVGSTPFAFALNQGTLNLDNLGDSAHMTGTLTSGLYSMVNFKGGGTTYATTGGAAFLGRLTVASGTTLRLTGDIAADSHTPGYGNQMDIAGTLVGLTAGSHFTNISGAGSFESRGTGTTVDTINLPTGSVTVPFGQLNSTSYLSDSTVVGDSAILTVATANTGSLTLGGTSTFDISDAFSVNGAVSGTGDITKLGIGGLIFKGGGTVANNVHINDGYLSGGNNTTLSGVINGAGGVSISGVGDTLRLTANNTYTGGTFVRVGELVLGNGGYTGSVTGDITVGSLGSDIGGITFNRAGSVNGSSDFFIPNHITGPGHLTQAGPNRMIVDTALEYTGATYITGGSLQIGNGGTAGSLALDVPADLVNHTAPIHVGNIVDNASLILNRSDALRLDNDITGTGTLTKIGEGTSTLAGALSYTGATTISNGTLEVTNSATNAGGISVASGAALSITGLGNVHGTIANEGNIVINRLAEPNQYNDSSYFLDFNTTGSGIVNKNDAIKAYMTGFTQANPIGINAGSLGYDIPSGTTTSSNIRVAGAGTFFKDGAGTLVITADSYNELPIQNLVVSGGTLQLGNGGATGLMKANTISVGAGGTMAFDLNTPLDFYGVISGEGSFRQSGSGVLTLGAANTYTGSTTIGTGSTLAIGGINSLGSIASTMIYNDGTLRFDRTYTYSGNSQGTGAIAVTAGTLSLTGLNAITGGGTIAPGATLSLGGTATFGGPVVNNGNLTIFTNAGPGSRSMPVSVTGAGTLTLSGGGTLRIDGDLNYTGGTVLQDNSTLMVSNDLTSTISAPITGTGNLVKIGDGTLIVTVDNFFTGTTTVGGGTLQLGTGGTTGSVGSLGDISLVGGTLAINHSDGITISSALSGSGGLTQLGSGRLYLTADSDAYNGLLTVAAGSSLQLGNGGTTGRVNSHFDVDGLLFTNRTNDWAMNAGLEGSGQVAMAGGGKIIVAGGEEPQYKIDFTGLLSNPGNVIELGTSGTYGTFIADRVDVDSAAVVVGDSTTFFTTRLTSQFASITLGNGGTTGSVTGPITGDGALIFNRSDDYTFSGNFAGRTLRQIGTGTTTYQGSGPVAGSVQVENGFLNLGTSVTGDIVVTGPGTVRLGGFIPKSLSGTGNVETFSGSDALFPANVSYTGQTKIASNTLSFTAGNVTLSGLVTGAGGITFSGPNTLTLGSGGTYTGPTVLTATYDGSEALQTPTLISAASLASSVSGIGTLQFDNAAAATASGNLTGDISLTKTNSGPLTLSGQNTFLGETRIEAGTVLAGHENALSANSMITFSNVAGVSLDLNGHDMTVGGIQGGGPLGGNIALGSKHLTSSVFAYTNYNGVISGTGGITLDGISTLQFTGLNTYSGGTEVVAATLAINNASNLGTGPVFLNGGTLAFMNNVSTEFDRPLRLEGLAYLAFENTLTLKSPVTGSGSLLVNGGTLVLSTALPNSLYVGGTTTLKFADGFELAPEHFEINSDLARLDLNGKSWTAALPLFAGGVMNSAAGDVTISGTVNTNEGFTITSTGGDIRFSGAIAHTGSKLTFTAEGTGRVLLSPASSGDIDSLRVGVSPERALAIGAGGTLMVEDISALKDDVQIWVRYGGRIELGGGSMDPAAPTVLQAGLAVDAWTTDTESTGVFNPLAGSSIRIEPTPSPTGFSFSFARGGGPALPILIGGSGNLTLVGAATGNDLGFAKVGAGRFTIDGDFSQWNGAVDVREGTFASTDPAFYATHNVNLQSGGTLDLLGATSVSFQSLTGNGTLALGATNFSINTTTAFNFAGSIVGTGDFAKSGTGAANLGTLTVGNVALNGGVTHIAGLVTANRVTVTGGEAYLDGGMVAGTPLQAKPPTSSDSANLYVPVSYVSTNGGTTFTGNIETTQGGYLQATTTNGTASFTSNAGRISVSGQNNGLRGTQTLVSNSGTIIGANGAQLSFGATFTNTGAISITGSNTILSVFGAPNLPLVFTQAAGSLTVGPGSLLTAKALTITGGSVLVNGGYQNNTGSSIVTLSGGSLTGSGQLSRSSLVLSGGSFSPGDSIGKMTVFTGTSTLAQNGKFVFEINDATKGSYSLDSGVTTGSRFTFDADPTSALGTNWDVLDVTRNGSTGGGIGVTSTASQPFVIDVHSLAAGNITGSIAGFDPTKNYAFTFARANVNTAVAGGITGFGANKFSVSTGSFANAFTGNFGVAQDGNNLVLVYNSSQVYNTAVDLSISDAAANGAFGGLTKLGTGTLTVTGTAAYTGATKITGGTLVAGSNTALGTADVVVSGTGRLSVPQGTSLTNEVTLAGGSFERTLSGSLAHSMDATSDLGLVNTTASLLAGESASTTTLVTSFSSSAGGAGGNFAAASQRLASDIYSLSGTGSNAFVLQLSVAATNPLDSFQLVWLNPSTNLWMNAVDGNTGNNASFGQIGYAGTFASFQSNYGSDLNTYMGAWGSFIDSGSVYSWSVLDHNSSFGIAAVPEPSAYAIAIVGLLGVIIVIRRRRKCLQK